jgi:phosphoglycolate phosphatase-like HAD superfamily hydrolase
MHILALDFDGVLCDSSREVFVVAVDAYASLARVSHQLSSRGQRGAVPSGVYDPRGAESYLTVRRAPRGEKTPLGAVHRRPQQKAGEKCGLEPDSGLLERLRPLRDDALGGGDGFRSDALYATFTELLPLGNRAEDFGVSLKAVENDLEISDQEQYDAFFGSIDSDWLASFHREFYDARSRLRKADTEAWLGLHLPYPDLAALLRGHRGRTKPAVATAKDARSVQLLLEHLGYEGVFDPELILDKETGVEKTHHLRALRERTGSDFNNITFVDDKVNHLVKVATLGVRPVLAGWGFNTPREHARARDLGYAVATLDDAETVLFEGESE